jgi:hypothetical protein
MESIHSSSRMFMMALVAVVRPDQFDVGFDFAGGAGVDQFLRLCDPADSRLLRTLPISFSVVSNLSTFKTGQPG